jgi:hypothetical protein
MIRALVRIDGSDADVILRGRNLCGVNERIWLDW